MEVREDLDRDPVTEGFPRHQPGTIGPGGGTGENHFPGNRSGGRRRTQRHTVYGAGHPTTECKRNDNFLPHVVGVRRLVAGTGTHPYQKSSRNETPGSRNRSSGNLLTPVSTPLHVGRTRPTEGREVDRQNWGGTAETSDRVHLDPKLQRRVKWD